MESHSKEQANENHIVKGIGSAISGIQTKGRYVPVEQDLSGGEWGIVHLYRDANETPGLYKESSLMGHDAWGGGNSVPKDHILKPNLPARDEDCTTLCILAVPSYLSPSDFLAFVGDETRQQVSHFRMIKTARTNRYMVLMKFKNGKKARDWQHEWNGKVFNSMEPETCHVVFLKSVEITQTPTTPSEDPSRSLFNSTSTFPQMTDDPLSATAPTTKPLAPRTSSLVELPTCPVCLERMDETTGLLTILCQHVFHCTCLQKWSGGGCPVCRYTHDDFSSRAGTQKHKSKIGASEYEVSDKILECETCHADVNLWQCLICGRVGCGRYEEKHAFQHYEQSGHTFCMDLDSKRVWDYADDVYVHRIIQDAAKPGEKLVELPGRRREGMTTALEGDEDIEAAKMENVALEYTHLLTSQLESQRVYFEEIVERAADKASEAAKAAEQAARDCEKMRDQVDTMAVERDELLRSKLPDLEAERLRLEKRTTKFEEMARSVNKRYLEEKSLANSLMERIKHLEETQLKQMERKMQDLADDNATKELLMEALREQLRDAMMQVAASNKLREMVERGELSREDLDGATITAGPARSQQRSRAQPSSSTPSTSANPNNRISSDADVFTRDFQTKLGLDVTTLERGTRWEDDRAAQLLIDFKNRMIEEGLIQNKEAGESEVHQSNTADVEGDSTTNKSKKRKGKGRKK